MSGQVKVPAQRQAMSHPGGAQLVNGVPHVLDGAKFPVRPLPRVDGEGDAGARGRPGAGVHGIGGALEREAALEPRHVHGEHDAARHVAGGQLGSLDSVLLGE